MVKSGDLIHLAYTPDLTSAGIAYVGQQLQETSGHRTRYSQKTLRQQVIDKAVELAFRRYLDGQEVQYTTAPGTAFGNPASFYLVLGGWRCNMHSCWIDQPEIVERVHTQPECLLEAAALLPSEQIISWLPGEKDIYIFAYVTGQFQQDHMETDRLAQSDQLEMRMHSPLAGLEAKLHGEEIFLAGFCTHPDYSRRSRRLTPRSRIFPACSRNTQTRILYVRELHAINELLAMSTTMTG